MAYDIENILMNQKDAVRELIHDGEYDKAMDRLETLRELWEECDYQYKLRELLRAIDELLWQEPEGEHWKTRQKRLEQRANLKVRFKYYFS